MFALLALSALAPTRVLDDPFESSLIYITPVEQTSIAPQVVYSNSENCSFLQVSNKSFVSSKVRGAKKADSSLEFKLTSLRHKACRDPLNDIDIKQARFFGSMVADVSVKALSDNCVITMCKDDYSVSVRLSSGMTELNGKIGIKFGSPHAPSIMIEVPMEAYQAHRGEVFR